MAQPSLHFTRRVRSRVGLRKSQASLFLEKSMAFGLRREDFLGKPRFINYLDNMHVSDECEYIIYNNYIVIKSIQTDVGITVLFLPRQFISTVKSVKKKRSSELND